MDKDFEGLV